MYLNWEVVKCFSYFEISMFYVYIYKMKVQCTFRIFMYMVMVQGDYWEQCNLSDLWNCYVQINNDDNGDGEEDDEVRDTGRQKQISSFCFARKVTPVLDTDAVRYLRFEYTNSNLFLWVLKLNCLNFQILSFLYFLYFNYLLHHSF